MALRTIRRVGLLASAVVLVHCGNAERITKQSVKVKLGLERHLTPRQELGKVVDFYNTRDTTNWPAPEVPQNVNKKEFGNLGLSAQEVDDLVTFLKTLTDGHTRDE